MWRTHRIWVFNIDNASNKFNTFIPQLISLFPGVQPDSAVPNLPRHVVYVFISRGTIIPKPYNIRWVYQSRLGMFSIYGIVLYNLFILINDKCEYLCKLEFVWHVQTINYLKLKIIHFQKGLVHAMHSNGPLHQVLLCKVPSDKHMWWFWGTECITSGLKIHLLHLPKCHRQCLLLDKWFKR